MAKISDYGLIRELELKGCASRSKSRLISHIAPEVLHTGQTSKVWPLLPDPSLFMLSCIIMRASQRLPPQCMPHMQCSCSP